MFVNKPWLRFIVEPEDGEPSGGATPPQDPPNDDGAKPEGDKPKEDEPLGEKGLKALQSERARAETLEKKLAAIEKKQEEQRIAKLGEKEKAEAERDAAAKEAAEARAALAIEKAARKHGLTDDDVALLEGLPADKVDAFAKRLSAGTKKTAPAGASGNEVTGSKQKASLEQQLADAQKNRDFQRVIAIKQQMYAK